MTVVCADELGPVIPRSSPPAPGWTADGHRVKAPLDYGRGPDKTWVYGALRVGDGTTITLAAPSRNSIGDQDLLTAVEAANPAGTIMVITDNLSSHTSYSTRTWLVEHPRIQHTFIPEGACWLNLQEGWWRLFRREALPGSRLPPRGDHPGHQGGDLPAQRSRPPVGVGPPRAVPAPPTPHLHLPDLRNAALATDRWAPARRRTPPCE
jgi:DDE superfamily endonuclease